jgi:hypothetical protein
VATHNRPPRPSRSLPPGRRTQRYEAVIPAERSERRDPRISPLPLPVLLLVIPQRSGGICFFPCRCLSSCLSFPKGIRFCSCLCLLSRLSFPKGIRFCSCLCPCRSIPSAPSSRPSAASGEIPAFRPCRCPFSCLSFRSAAEESASSLAVACPLVCHSRTGIPPILPPTPKKPMSTPPTP